MHKLLVVILLECVASLVWAQLATAGPLPEVNHSAIDSKSVQEALVVLKVNPGVQIRQQQGWTIITDVESEKASALWSFSPESYSAYPAVVIRTTFEKEGGVYIDMKVLCQAAKEPCDALVREFQALNDRIKADIQQGAH